MRRHIVIIPLTVLALIVPTRSQRAEGAYRFMWVYADPAGGPDACDSGFQLHILATQRPDGRLEVPSSLSAHLPSLGTLLDNGFSLCVKPILHVGLIELEGVRITLRADGSHAIERTRELVATRACCRPPLPYSPSRGGPGAAICEDMPYPDTPWPSCENPSLVGGQWAPLGSTCDTVTCDLDYQVCCYPPGQLGGACHERTADACRRSAGVVFAPGASCGDVPSPCDGPFRSCCSPTVGCLRVRADESCPADSSAADDCSACPCQDPPCLSLDVDEDAPPADTRACCLSGVCVADVEVESCAVRGGRPTIACATGIDALDCPPATGACCPLVGDCRASTEASCSAPNDVFLGQGVACPDACPVRGACCVPIGPGLSECRVLGEAGCSEAGGQFLMADLSCDQARCPGSVAVSEPAEPGPCDTVLGPWPWAEGVVAELYPDGTVARSGGLGMAFGSWECIDGAPTIRVTWQTGEPRPCLGATTTAVIETLALIRDGSLQVLNGSNQCGDALSVAREEPVVVPEGLTCVWHAGGIHPSACMCTDQNGQSNSAPHSWCPDR